MVTRSAETEDEQLEILYNSADSLDAYVEGARERANDVLRENGVDPDTLFDLVTVKVTDEPAKKKFEGTYLKWAALQRDSLSPEALQAVDSVLRFERLSAEAHQAIDVILRCRAVQHDLNSQGSRDTLCNGIRLATADEHLTANLAWRKSVAAGRSTIVGGVKGAEARHGEKGSKAARRVEAYESRRANHPEETKKESKIWVAEQCEPPVGYKQIEANILAVARIKKEP